MIKTCRTCNEEKDVSEFYKHKANKDGLFNRCKTCHIAYTKKWRRDNADKVAAWEEANADYQKEYYDIEENRERKKRNQRNWFRKNSEEINARKRDRYKKDKKYREKKLEWTRSNPDKIKSYTQNRRSRIAGNGGSFTEEEWQELCNKYDNICLCCGEKENLQADHVVPVSKGGTSYISNIQPLCQPCNSRKGNRCSTDYRF